jgi:hypothetical protein
MKLNRAVLSVAACAGLAVSARAQYITNGDFETGDFTGWTEFGETTYNGVWGGLPHGGGWSGYFGPIASPGGISQNLAGANPGDRFIVSFWLVNEDGSTPNSCNVTLDGQTILDVTDFTDTSYEHFTATITITTANPALVFTFTDPPYYLDLDDVTVTRDNSAPPCYANCDGSTIQPILNVLDFTCFLNRFAAGDTYANCDGSTTQPVLNVLDFGCFLNRFASGCT